MHDRYFALLSLQVEQMQIDGFHPPDLRGTLHAIANLEGLAQLPQSMHHPNWLAYLVFPLFPSEHTGAAQFAA